MPTPRARSRLLLFVLTLNLLNLSAQSPLERSAALAREKHYREARQALSGVSEPEPIPQRIAFHRLRAAIASGLSEPVAAAREMESALALAPGDPALLLPTAVAELAANQLDDAARHATAAGNLSPALALLGDIEERRGNFVQAATAYQSAVQLAPDREPYRIALAYDLIKHQRFSEAADFLHQSLALFPKSAQFFTLLGIAQYAGGYSDDAIASLENALRIDPTLTAAAQCLARVTLDSSAAPAPEITQLLCPSNPTVCAALHLRTARATGDSQLLADSLAQLKRASASDILAPCELARAYEWSNQLSLARAQLETCVRRDPDPRNHYRLGLLYSKLGLPSLAHDQMNLRAQALGKLSDQTAAGLSALQSFHYNIR